jgi:hypothetical protein
MAARSRQAGRAVTILDVGRVYLRANQMPVGFGDDVAFALVDPSRPYHNPEGRHLPWS